MGTLLQLCIISRVKVIDELVVQLLVRTLLGRHGREVDGLFAFVLTSPSDEVRLLLQDIVLLLVQSIMNRLILLLDSLGVAELARVLVDYRAEIALHTLRVITQWSGALADASHTTV